MYKLPHELVKNVLVKIFGNNKNSRKISEKIGIDDTSPDSNPKPRIRQSCQKTVKNLLQNIPKKPLFYLILSIFLQYFVHDCLRKLISYLPQTLWNLNFLKILGFQKFLLLLKFKFQASKLRQRPKFYKFQKSLFHTLASRKKLILKIDTKIHSKCSRVTFSKRFYYFILTSDQFWSFHAF